MNDVSSDYFLHPLEAFIFFVHGPVKLNHKMIAIKGG